MDDVRTGTLRESFVGELATDDGNRVKNGKAGIYPLAGIIWREYDERSKGEVAFGGVSRVGGAWVLGEDMGTSGGGEV